MLDDSGKIVKPFARVGMRIGNEKWNQSISRVDCLYNRPGELRSEFARDYNRIIHCLAFRRLKRKTQVFFATENDHICTRIEHVNHVMAVSYTISEALGLNSELTNAIAIAHDLGHPPFGHEGETTLNEITEKNVGSKFWHEKNGLWFVDNIETLDSPKGKKMNLALTYAVRDGIICHSGEIDEKAITPRDEEVSLQVISEPNKYSPYSWEGCVVKIADKIAFFGRDIEDAMTLKVINKAELRSYLIHHFDSGCRKLLGSSGVLNNTVLMDIFIKDLCQNSDPNRGIGFSEPVLNLIKAVRQLNIDLIYTNNRLDNYKKYSKLVLESIFDILEKCYQENKILSKLKKTLEPYHTLQETFCDWIIKYSDVDINEKAKRGYQNKVIYTISKKQDYLLAIVHYLSGMTDSFTIRVFGELTSFLKYQPS